MIELERFIALGNIKVYKTSHGDFHSGDNLDIIVRQCAKYRTQYSLVSGGVLVYNTGPYVCGVDVRRTEQTCFDYDHRVKISAYYDGIMKIETSIRAQSRRNRAYKAFSPYPVEELGAYPVALVTVMPWTPKHTLKIYKLYEGFVRALLSTRYKEGKMTEHTLTFPATSPARADVRQTHTARRLIFGGAEYIIPSLPGPNIMITDITTMPKIMDSLRAIENALFALPLEVEPHSLVKETMEYFFPNGKLRRRYVGKQGFCQYPRGSIVAQAPCESKNKIPGKNIHPDDTRIARDREDNRPPPDVP